jgi:hypothetical protein
MPVMILPPRGTSVDTNRRAELRRALDPNEVVRRIDKLIELDQVRLTDVFKDDDIHQLCDELEIEFREREFTPAITLGLFVSQCLSRGDACSTVGRRRWVFVIFAATFQRTSTEKLLSEYWRTTWFEC